ncbi:MAG: DoxX family protein [Vicinamibacteraceae bacterium]
MNGLLFGGAGAASVIGDLGLLLLRAFTGLALAFGHGINKIPPSAGLIDRVDGYGFPLPIVFAWSAGLSELVGGCLIAVGLLTRPAALFVFITMGVAVLFAHAGDPFSVREKALLFGMVALLLGATGAGRFALDPRVRQVRNR